MLPLAKRGIVERVRKSVLSTSRHLSDAKFRRLIEVGQFSEKIDRYEPGQIFLNKTFAYRGIIVASFDCKEFKRKETSSYTVVPYYQVLIHRGDWKEIRFPVDHTSYLSEGKEGKVLNCINGMDSIPHEDVLPLNVAPCSSNEFKPPIEHDLFSTLFKLADENKPELGFVPLRNLNKQRSWMKPQTHFENTTDAMTVALTTYYLGQSSSNGQIKYYWRYVVRVQNNMNESVILRERQIKIFSLNHLTQITAQGVLGEFPILSDDHPAYQFSSTIDLPQKKGGKLVIQRGSDASTFEIDLPTVVLECNNETNSIQHHTSENIIH